MTPLTGLELYDRFVTGGEGQGKREATSYDSKSCLLFVCGVTAIVLPDSQAEKLQDQLRSASITVYGPLSFDLQRLFFTRKHPFREQDDRSGLHLSPNVCDRMCQASVSWLQTCRGSLERGRGALWLVPTLLPGSWSAPTSGDLGTPYQAECPPLHSTSPYHILRGTAVL
ncbi:hypothetical protein JZ751_019029 [Albula glossodonta]|uniref:Uncharacterized protein n=1 Tax=Albula glossodonta TaxID=121402 RepID=A0A8T2NN92_9TELE|nr:hypothetical protein JZ751_019029 [Albula glossodonta]